MDRRFGNLKRRFGERSAAIMGMSGIALCVAIACGDQPEDADAVSQRGSELQVEEDTLSQPAESHTSDGQFRFEGAETVVLGTVEQVSARLGQNEWGDLLILSTVRLRVSGQLRGERAETLEFELEGGTLGDTTLNVSDLPKLSPGDHGVFALRRHRIREAWVPNLRGEGVRIGQVEGHLDAIKHAEQVSR